MSRLILAALSTMFLASPLFADLEVETVSDSPLDCDDPSVVQAPGGLTLVSWLDADQQVWTAVMPPTIPDLAREQPYPPVNHGPGISARLAVTWQGPMLVWTTDTGIYYNLADAGGDFPDSPVTIELGLDLSDTELDVWGVVEPGWSVAWVVFTTPNDTGGTTVWFLRIAKGPHDGPFVMAENLPFPTRAQVTAASGSPQPWPRVYYLRDWQSLAYRTEVAWNEFSAEEIVPLPVYGGEFDVAGDGTGLQNILSQGPQPTCPCNVIHSTRQDADGVWHDPEPLTVHTDDYDWPMSPCVRLSSQSHAHAFWTQLGSAGDLTAHRRILEYWVRDDTGWTDHGGDLVPYEVPGLGSRVAMDLGEHSDPAFAWTVKDSIGGGPQPRRVVLARVPYLTAVGDAAPRPVATLAAWPNPFNPKLTLAGTSPAGAPAVLTVHDLAGRRVAQLSVLAGPDGRFTTEWNGTDASGRFAPSGVYLVRMGAGAEAVTRRVVLAR